MVLMIECMGMGGVSVIFQQGNLIFAFGGSHKQETKSDLFRNFIKTTGWVARTGGRKPRKRLWI